MGQFRPVRPLTERESEEVEKHCPLVTRIVTRMGLSPTSVAEHEDFFQAGVIGLIGAVRSFDPGRGLRFSTFASCRIKGAIIDSLREYDRLSRGHRKAVRAGKATEPTHRPIHDAKRDSRRKGNPDDRDEGLRLLAPRQREPDAQAERRDDRRRLSALVRDLDPIEFISLKVAQRGALRPEAQEHLDAAVRKLRRRMV